AVPTVDRVPPIELEVVEVPAPDGPFGAKGVGEPPVVGVPAAVANAVTGAVGTRVYELPLTPERVWTQLQAQPPSAAPDGQPQASEPGGAVPRAQTQAPPRPPRSARTRGRPCAASSTTRSGCRPRASARRGRIRSARRGPDRCSSRRCRAA